MNCGFFALEPDEPPVQLLTIESLKKGRFQMTKILVAAVATLAVLSVGACAGKAPIGKGKAPAPVVTKG